MNQLVVSPAGLRPTTHVGEHAPALQLTIADALEARAGLLTSARNDARALLVVCHRKVHNIPEGRLKCSLDGACLANDVTAEPLKRWWNFIRYHGTIMHNTQAQSYQGCGREKML